MKKSISVGSDDKNAKHVKAKGEKKAVVEVVQENVTTEQSNALEEVEILLQRR